MSEEYNLFYFFKQFPDEESCWKYLEKRRWGQYSHLSALRQCTKDLPLQKRKDFQVCKLQKAIFGENGYNLREL